MGLLSMRSFSRTLQVASRSVQLAATIDPGCYVSINARPNDMTRSSGTARYEIGHEIGGSSMAALDADAGATKFSARRHFRFARQFFTRSVLSVVFCASLLGLAVPSSAQIRRVPAEWEPQEALWLQWPGRWEKTYEPAFAQIANVVVQYEPLHILYDSNTIRNQARAAITAAGGNPDHPNIAWHLIRNDSAWMRDNGPVYVVEDGKMRIQDWGFDAWGGAFGNVPYANDDAVPTAVGSLLGLPVDSVNIVHERGNLEFNGVDTVMLNWNVIGNPNRGNGYASKAAAEADLRNCFGVKKVIWADGPITGDRTAGHIDGFARFIDANRVVIANWTLASHCQPGDPDDRVYDATAAAAAAAGFEVIRMDFQASITYGGETFDADYMNWGVGNGWVILVGFGNPATDNAAKAQLEAWFPGRDVYVIEMLDSWISGGGVHCHTNDQPKLAADVPSMGDRHWGSAMLLLLASILAAGWVYLRRVRGLASR